MLRLALIASMYLFAFPMYADPGHPQPVRAGFDEHLSLLRVDSQPGHMQEVISKLRQKQIGALAVTDSAPAGAVLIPLLAAGLSTLPGAPGLSTSELTLHLPALRTSTQQKLRMFWMPAGPGETVEYVVDQTSEPVTTFDLASLGLTGIGAMLVVALDADGEPDPNGLIDAYSRMTTHVDGKQGDLFLSVPSERVANVN